MECFCFGGAKKGAKNKIKTNEGVQGKCRSSNEQELHTSKRSNGIAKGRVGNKHGNMVIMIGGYKGAVLATAGGHRGGCGGGGCGGGGCGGGGGGGCGGGG
ncbi:hypothetical protein TanjilG_14446 [Lupinus angustifolius]|uniref:Uncharacterized protein n=1 Tax=Lupinus angustifolius TaxID=3871 RepID=A0A1J7H4G0_LUPAN|nr:hypothetical protein TanjilG_14446 [Lupinus angustifolius]